MASEPIQRWLERKIARHILGCWAGAVLSPLAGLVVLYLTFLLAYVALFVADIGISNMTGFIFDHEYELGHHWRLLLAWFFEIALCIEAIRRAPDDFWNNPPIDETPGARALVPIFGASSLWLANVGFTASLITEILYCGPRLVVRIVPLAREARRSRAIKTAECAQVLRLLADRDSAVTYDEIRTLLPDADWTNLNNGLSRVEGIVFLEKGLGLTDDLREELKGWGERRAGPV